MDFGVGLFGEGVDRVGGCGVDNCVCWREFRCGIQAKDCGIPSAFRLTTNKRTKVTCEV